MGLKKSDFYFGALISRLMKTGSVPAIIEDGEGRSIYSISNDHGEFEIYTKYRSNPDSKNKGSRWDFAFSEDEVNEIKQIERKEGISYLFCLICGKEGLAKSEITFLTYDEIRTIIGEGYTSPTRRVVIGLTDGSWTYKVYGTGLERTRNPLRVTRNVSKRLTEIGFMKVC